MPKNQTKLNREMKKIVEIKAINKFGKHFSWSADTLLWNELPRWLLRAIEMELPTYQIKIEYEK